MSYIKIVVLSSVLSCAVLNLAATGTLNTNRPIIENPIDFGWGRDLDHQKWRERMPVYARFWFQDLPEFKKESVLKLSFQATRSFDDSIIIFIDGNASTFDAHPNKIVWKGPIKKGNILESLIKIQALEIGYHYLAVLLFYQNKPLFDYYVTFNIDNTGNVIHLSNSSYPGEQEPNHLPIDSLTNELIFRYREHLSEERRVWENFQNTFRITPIPAIGDTVICHFSLLATRDYPNGVQLELVASLNIQVLDLPKNWTGFVHRNNVYEGEFKLLFKEPGESRLILRALGNYFDSVNNRQDFTVGSFDLHFLMNNDGKLSYVGRNDKHYRPDKSRESVAEALGEKHQSPHTETYIFEPRVKVLNWSELKNDKEENRK